MGEGNTIYIGYYLLLLVDDNCAITTEITL